MADVTGFIKHWKDARENDLFEEKKINWQRRKAEMPLKTSSQTKMSTYGGGERLVFNFKT